MSFPRLRATGRSRPARPRAAVLAAVLVLVALTAGACAAGQPMTREEAREWTRRALHEAGLDGVRVEPGVAATVFPEDGAGTVAPTPVWRTRAHVPGGTVELLIGRREGEAYLVRDVRDTPDPEDPEGTDSTELLTDEQFEALDDFHWNPAAARTRERSIAIGVALAALVLAVGLHLGTWSRGRVTPRAGP